MTLTHTSKNPEKMKQKLLIRTFMSQLKIISKFVNLQDFSKKDVGI